MCHSRTLNNKINKLQEKAFRVVYKNDNHTSQQLLEKDNYITINDRNLRKLDVKMLSIIFLFYHCHYTNCLEIVQNNACGLRNKACLTPKQSIMAWKPIDAQI